MRFFPLGMQPMDMLLTVFDVSDDEAAAFRSFVDPSAQYQSLNDQLNHF